MFQQGPVTKGEAAEHTRLFIAEFNVRVKYIRTDGGGEFSSRPFQRLLSIKGIIHQSSETETSASNGKAERFHRTLMDSARAMLWASTLPERFWGMQSCMQATSVIGFLHEQTRISKHRWRA